MITGNTIALTRWTFVGKGMLLLFNMLSRLILAFLPRSKCLLISWLQSPSAVILEPPRIRSLTVSIVSPFICHEVMGLDAMILFFWMLSFNSFVGTALNHDGSGKYKWYGDSGFGNCWLHNPVHLPFSCLCVFYWITSPVFSLIFLLFVEKTSEKVDYFHLYLYLWSPDLELRTEFTNLISHFLWSWTLGHILLSF